MSYTRRVPDAVSRRELHVRLTEDEHRAAHAFAKKHNRRLSDVARLALKHYMRAVAAGEACAHERGTDGFCLRCDL